MSPDRCEPSLMMMSNVEQRVRTRSRVSEALMSPAIMLIRLSSKTRFPQLSLMSQPIKAEALSKYFDQKL